MYQNLMIINPAVITLKNNQLMIQGKTIASFPIEDISTVVIDNRQSKISSAALDSLTQNGTAVIICGTTHHPSGILLPFAAYSRRPRMIQAQIRQPKPRIKQLWKAIIQQKIINQGRCLQFMGKKDTVTPFASRVFSGDKSNRESIAASRYFNQLFGEGFSRRSDDVRNHALNYGYSIMRASLARYIAVYGFEPCLGIFHHNETNAFNLADDLIEPFRPIVDLFVGTHISTFSDGLTPLGKKELVNLLTYQISYREETISVNNSLESVVQSLCRCYLNKEEELQLPTLLPLNPHTYE